MDLRWLLVAAPALPLAVASAVYPSLLRIASGMPRTAGRNGALPAAAPPPDPAEWPLVSVVIAAYNADGVIGRTLEQLLRTTYPAGRLQIVVVSDGSTDRTDAVVRGYAPRGVELLRVPRGGKTLAENQAAAVVRGEIVVCTDASILVHPEAITALVRRLAAEPRLGVVSGRSVVVPARALAGDPSQVARAEGSEGGYSNFVHAMRTMETALGAIVGATGGLYAQRREVFRVPLPAQVTRDLACTMVAFELGYGSAQVNEGVCVVGEAATLQGEYRRKVRTMLNGLDTMWHFRRLLDPRRAGWYAWRLWGHKVSRYLMYPLLPLAALALGQLASGSRVAALLLAGGVAAMGLAVAVVRMPAGRQLPRVVSGLGFAAAALLAGVVAWWSFVRGRHAVVWEPTRRESAPAGP